MSGTNNGDDRPRSLSDPDVRRRRVAMLTESHIAPLTQFVEDLQARNVGEVPWFDPLDGGVKAKALFLLEKPGPMTVEPEGSGFISRDNDDPTAEAIHTFMLDAGLDRKDVVIWNVIPAWNGTRDITGPELSAGINHLGALIDLLPDLRLVMIVGRKAAKAIPHIHDRGIRVFESFHPSPIVKASNRTSWDAIPSEWSKIKPYLT